ncbi:hypothetical protein NRB20_01650 [Nocardia sp. RB20]|uniref:Uncharacterized protein n=1 Tax=Nocardia macrotermitis TaxID=2585198 RepID=A0A7K0CVU2_9NOCA|nr:hypothetical protein [Nocardia macrotermitis]
MPDRPASTPAPPPRLLHCATTITAWPRRSDPHGTNRWAPSYSPRWLRQNRTRDPTGCREPFGREQLRPTLRASLRDRAPGAGTFTKPRHGRDPNTPSHRYEFISTAMASADPTGIDARPERRTQAPSQNPTTAETPTLPATATNSSQQQWLPRIPQISTPGRSAGHRHIHKVRHSRDPNTPSHHYEFISTARDSADVAGIGARPEWWARVRS